MPQKIDFTSVIQKIADWLFSPDKYLVMTPWYQRIGHLVLDIKVAISICKKSNRTLVLIPNCKSANQELFYCNLDCQKLNIKDVRIYFLRVIIFILYNLIRPIYNRFVYHFNRLHLYNLPLIASSLAVGYHKKWQKEDCILGIFDDHYVKHIQNPYSIKFTELQLNQGKELLQNLGIKDNDWWVCLHVREEGYLPQLSYHTPRDSSIANYIPAIRYITERGGYVIRMGDPSMRSLPKMERVIDYVKTTYYSDLANLFLLANCKFLIGTSSGGSDVNCLFQKPSLLVNTEPDFLVQCKVFQNLFLLPKHFFAIRENRPLSLKEVVQYSISNNAQNLYESIGKSNHITIENTPLEIKESVKEFIEVLEDSSGELLVQKKQKMLELYKSHKEDFNYLSEEEQASLEVIIKECIFSSFYLENCWDNSPYLDDLSELYSGK